MHKIVLIKQQPDSSKYLLYLYSRIFLRSFLKEMRRRGFFTSSDYSYSLVELNNEIVTLTLTFGSLPEEIIRSALKVKPSFTKENIRHSINEIMMATGKNFNYDVNRVKEELLAVHDLGWIDFEDVKIYKAEPNKQIPHYLFNEIGETSRHYRVLAARLKGDYLDKTLFAPLLFRLVMEPLFMEILHCLRDKYPCATNIKDIYEQKHSIRLLEFPMVSDVSFYEIGEYIEECLRSFDPDSFTNSLISYTQKDLLALPRADLVLDTMFKETRSIAGASGWRSFTTAHNIRELLSHTSLHIGDLATELTFDRTVGEYIFDGGKK